MKNIIPIVVAVVLGFVAVFTVSRTISKQADTAEKKVEVVAASRALSVNETLTEAFISPRLVPVSSLPKQHIKWENRSMVVGQKVLHAIPRGDYVLLADIGMSRSVGNVIGDGEWGVTVNFANMSKLLQPGDEIVVVGSFNITREVKQNKNADAPPQKITQTVTAVVLPRVRIIEITDQGVLLSLPPQQALALTAIRRKAELYALVRKTNDTKALNRKDGGIFEDSTLVEMIKGLSPISIPNVPAEVKE